jgi:hypothetical protein
MLEILLQAIPAQLVKFVVGGQSVQMSIYQKSRGLFVDITVGGVAIAQGVLAHDGVPLVSRDYMGFIGNLLFLDTRGRDDPTYDGLGTRYKLCYLNAGQYAFIQE